MTERPAKILVCLEPGVIRDSLCSLLASLPDVRVVGVLPTVGDIPARLRQDHPDMVLLDWAADSGRQDILQAIRLIEPRSKCVVIVDQTCQRQQAFQSGADEVLLRGCTGMEFKATFLHLIALGHAAA